MEQNKKDLSDDEIEEFLRFECQRCSEAMEGSEDGKIYCHLDGQERAKTDSCEYWR